MVERGASGLATILQPRQDLPQLLVNESASPSELASATIRRLKRLENAAQRVTEAVILVGPRKGKLRLDERCLLCRALLSHQIDAGGGKIIFRADYSSSPDTRQQLLAIAGTLTAELGTSEVSVSVRFDLDGQVSTRPVASLPMARDDVA